MSPTGEPPDKQGCSAGMHTQTGCPGLWRASFLLTHRHIPGKDRLHSYTLFLTLNAKSGNVDVATATSFLYMHVYMCLENTLDSHENKSDHGTMGPQQLWRRAYLIRAVWPSEGAGPQLDRSPALETGQRNPSSFMEAEGRLLANIGLSTDEQSLVTRSSTRQDQ